jgi:DNA-binding MarR family transcriptional regulator
MSNTQGFPADALRRAVAKLQRQLRRLRADHGVSASKLIILGRLNRAEAPLTAVDLARLERLQPQSLTRIIAELEELGLVSRRQSDVDRRQILIDITQAGRDLLHADAREQTAWIAAAVEARLSGTEQGLLALAVSLLDRIGEAE